MPRIKSYRWQSESTPKSRVLLAEDDAEMRRFLADSLREEGYEVIEAASGVELLERLEFEAEDGRWLPMFDVVVTDVRMPGVTGLEVLEGIRNVEWSTGVILVSAFADQEVHDQARRLGACAVLAKPFPLGEFLTAVRDVAPPNHPRGE